MTQQRRFIQCDVFTSVPTKGNALAIVVDGEGLSDEQMQGFAAWTNLAETAFLLPPTDPAADYKVRIFTTVREMLFAGHPTLGSCAAWLHCGGVPRKNDLVRQECGIGLVDIDISKELPAFFAPPTQITTLPSKQQQHISNALGLDPAFIKQTALLDNGPVWQVFELVDAASVLAVDSLRVNWAEHRAIGLIGAHPQGSECDFEVRMLAPSSGMSEDPITGSLNAALAHWMVSRGVLLESAVVSQGTCIDRVGRVFVSRQPETGDVLIGGDSHILIEGMVVL